MNRRKFLWTGLIFVPAASAVAQSLRSPAFVGALNRPSGAASDSLQDSYQWQVTTYHVNMSANYYKSATDFYAGASYTLHEFRIYCEQLGTPTMTATPKIFDDNSGSPGSVITGGTGNSFALNTCPPASSPASFAITGFTCSIVNGTRYWLVLDFGSGFSNTNTVKIHCALRGDSLYHAKKADSPPPWNNDAYQTAMGWQAYGV